MLLDLGEEMKQCHQQCGVSRFGARAGVGSINFEIGCVSHVTLRSVLCASRRVVSAVERIQDGCQPWLSAGNREDDRERVSRVTRLASLTLERFRVDNSVSLLAVHSASLRGSRTLALLAFGLADEGVAVSTTTRESTNQRVMLGVE